MAENATLAPLRRRGGMDLLTPPTLQYKSQKVDIISSSLALSPRGGVRKKRIVSYIRYQTIVP
jgi:hypothetical protein